MPKTNRGGRRSGGGGSGGIGAGFRATGATTGQSGSQLSLAKEQTVGDWDDNGNPNVIKFQGQVDDKTANFLAKVSKTTDLNQIQKQTNDPWAFHDNEQQKLLQALNITGRPTVVSEADFNKYVQQTGSTVLYRGWSGQNAVDRFKNSPNNHIGNGINGDGYYFAPDIGTAKTYGVVGTKAALSPNARVISATAVKMAIASASPKLHSSLSKTDGKVRTFGGNGGMAQMAIKMGYNTIDAGWAVIPLTGDAVIMSGRNVF